MERFSTAFKTAVADSLLIVAFQDFSAISIKGTHNDISQRFELLLCSGTTGYNNG